MSEDAASTTQIHTRRRKLQAMLAGGAVLGVGAIMTLAAWNDSEFAEGIFGAGSFNLEGAPAAEPTDADYIDHDTAGGAATLAFEATNMSPAETVYAPFTVRLDEATTVGGTIAADGGISVASSSTGDNVDNLSYTVYADPATCDAEGVAGGNVVASGDTLNADGLVNNTAAVDLTSGVEGEAGTPVLLCFAVESAGEDVFEQGVGANATWEVVATSNDS